MAKAFACSAASADGDVESDIELVEVVKSVETVLDLDSGLGEEIPTLVGAGGTEDVSFKRVRGKYRLV